MSFLMIWSFTVAAEHRQVFERIYASDGDWARLFRQADGFLGTELLKDAERPGHYMTIDRWTSQKAYTAFKSQHAKAYTRLDAHCEGLTMSETRIGSYDVN